MSTILKQGDQFVVFASEGTGRSYYSMNDAMKDLKSYENYKAVNTRFKYTWSATIDGKEYICIERQYEFGKLVRRQIVDRISDVEYFRRKLAGELRGTP